MLLFINFFLLQSIPSETTLDLVDTGKIGKNDRGLSEVKMSRIMKDDDNKSVEEKNEKRDDEVIYLFIYIVFKAVIAPVER